MKKMYIIFAILLVVLFVSYTLLKSYTKALEQESIKLQEELSKKKELADLRNEIESKFTEYDSLIDSRLDSLEQLYRQQQLELPDSVSDSVQVDTLVESSADSLPKVVVDTTAKPKAVPFKDPQPGKKDDAQLIKEIEEKEKEANIEDEIKIYNYYLKKRWALPSDLTKYELKIAKHDIYEEIAKKNKMSKDKVIEIIDRVYEYRKRSK